MLYAKRCAFWFLAALIVATPIGCSYVCDTFPDGISTPDDFPAWTPVVVTSAVLLCVLVYVALHLSCDIERDKAFERVTRNAIRVR